MRCALFLGLASVGLGQSLLVDGGFESPVRSGTQNISGSFTLGAWSGVAVSGGGNAGLVVGTDNGLAPLEGRQHFTFNGGNPGSNGGYIEQAFATVVGQSYRVTFGVGRSGGGQDLSLSAGVFEGVSFVSGSTFAPPAAVGYALGEFSFVAGSGSARLRFTDTSGGNSISDLYLDNVAVSAVPEPGTWALLAGAAALGLAVWRRRRA